MLVRHPVHVTERSSPRPDKTSSNPVELLGFDIETDSLTGKPMLLGDHTGRLWLRPKSKDRPKVILDLLRHANLSGKMLAHWREFDAIAVYRLLCETLPVEERRAACGLYDKEGFTFLIDDTEVTVKRFGKGTCYEFGLPGKRKFRVPSFDISSFYYEGIEKTCKSLGFTWYSKGEERFHLVDWQLYRRDPAYFEGVNNSNRMDALAAKMLGDQVSADFFRAFKAYPNTLYSAGGLCKAALSTQLTPGEYSELNFFRLLDAWYPSWETSPASPDGEAAREIWCMGHEAYSGGLIDCYNLGHAEKAEYADIASAYPAVIMQLPDMYRSLPVVTEGDSPGDMRLQRGWITIPENLCHSVSFKTRGETKARCSGRMRVTIWDEERAWIESRGGTFEPEVTLSIKPVETSPLARACKLFLELRQNLKGTSAERIAKESANSLYGVSYELSDTHAGGYNAGEVYNPLVAGYITAISRLRLAKALQGIRDNGGKLIAAMTDSISWVGSADMLPRDYTVGKHLGGVREKKTPGYFETPTTLSDYLSLGPGRYSYRVTSPKGEVKTVNRARGYRLTRENRLHDYVKDPEMTLPCSLLVSPGIVANSNRYTFEDLGRVIHGTKRLDPWQLSGKRTVTPQSNTSLLSGLYPTFEMERDNADNTLPGERELLRLKAVDRAEALEYRKKLREVTRARNWKGSKKPGRFPL